MSNYETATEIVWEVRYENDFGQELFAAVGVDPGTDVSTIESLADEAIMDDHGFDALDGFHVAGFRIVEVL